MSTGNTIAANMPIFKLSPKADDTIPATVGPPEHPTSPANANSANINVPPFFKDAAALLNVPGHIIPTDKPHNPHPISPITGFGTNEIIK